MVDAKESLLRSDIIFCSSFFLNPETGGLNLHFQALSLLGA
jgi:hypothetical protein